MNLSDVNVFKKLATTLSFTQAARQIGVSRSTVSKQLSRLEQDLGVILVNRSTRRVSLTEAGRTFFAHTSEIDKTIEHAADLVRSAEESPLGTVSFTTSTAMGLALMPALVTQFQPRWPELKLNVQFDDQVQDIIACNLDLAIRISRKLDDSNLIARRLLKTDKVLVASPKYLSESGIPVTPSDLKGHHCLGMGNAVTDSATWTFADGKNGIDVPVDFSFTTNNYVSLILAACLHNGIVYVPRVCVAGDLARNKLQVIPGFTSPDVYGVYAVYPHRNVAAKVKLLVDFIEEILNNVDSVDRWAPIVGRPADGSKFLDQGESGRKNSNVA